MALYLGSSKKLKIQLEGVSFRLNIPTPSPITSDIRLLSSEGYILKDINGLYLLAKEDE